MPSRPSLFDDDHGLDDVYLTISGDVMAQLAVVVLVAFTLLMAWTCTLSRAPRTRWIPMTQVDETDRNDLAMGRDLAPDGALELDVDGWVAMDSHRIHIDDHVLDAWLRTRIEDLTRRIGARPRLALSFPARSPWKDIWTLYRSLLRIGLEPGDLLVRAGAPT